ncbi:hypothetical protein BpHYR1_051836 [Brachionus plicatilis]|uniref:Uncharacterized protein n=1 Tax=Brachionus plicatilis TaxID=10195 RepID=A0A3M7RT59_BRAPC|nr:hypothetical protein BpHYR1_051836 [Brachionus plicatilis]
MYSEPKLQQKNQMLCAAKQIYFQAALSNILKKVANQNSINCDYDFTKSGKCVRNWYQIANKNVLVNHLRQTLIYRTLNTISQRD